MFIKNNTNYDIPNDDIGITYEGYEFFLPANSVCAIWDEAGEHIVKELYKIESETGFDEKTGKKDSAPLPPVTLAERNEWDGRTYAMVKRWKIVGQRAHKIANGNVENLIKLAEERGVDERTVRNWKHAETVDPEDIARVIDQLPVPEEIRFPESAQEAPKQQSAPQKKESDDEAELNKEVEEIINQ